MKPSEIIEKFLGGPIAKKIELEAESEAHAARRRLRDRLDALRRDEARELDRLGREVAAAMVRVRDVEATLRRAVDAALTARAADRAARSTFWAQTEALERELRAAADPRLEEFIRWTAEEGDRMRDKVNVRATIEKRSIWNKATGGFDDRISSNGRAVTARCLALRNAREKARGLQLQALSADEVLRALADLRAEIPVLGTLDEERAAELLAAEPA